eukprot:UN07724
MTKRDVKNLKLGLCRARIGLSFYDENMRNVFEGKNGLKTSFFTRCRKWRRVLPLIGL